MQSAEVAVQRQCHLDAAWCREWLLHLAKKCKWHFRKLGRNLDEVQFARLQTVKAQSLLYPRHRNGRTSRGLAQVKSTASPKAKGKQAAFRFAAGRRRQDAQQTTAPNRQDSRARPGCGFVVGFINPTRLGDVRVPRRLSVSKFRLALLPSASRRNRHRSCDQNHSSFHTALGLQI